MSGNCDNTNIGGDKALPMGHQLHNGYFGPYNLIMAGGELGLKESFWPGFSHNLPSLKYVVVVV